MNAFRVSFKLKNYYTTTFSCDVAEIVILSLIIFSLSISDIRIIIFTISFSILTRVIILFKILDKRNIFKLNQIINTSLNFDFKPVLRFSVPLIFSALAYNVIEFFIRYVLAQFIKDNNLAKNNFLKIGSSNS